MKSFMKVLVGFALIFAISCQPNVTPVVDYGEYGAPDALEYTQVYSEAQESEDVNGKIGIANKWFIASPTNVTTPVDRTLCLSANPIWPCLDVAEYGMITTGFKIGSAPPARVANPLPGSTETYYYRVDFSANLSSSSNVTGARLFVSDIYDNLITARVYSGTTFSIIFKQEHLISADYIQREIATYIEPINVAGAGFGFAEYKIRIESITALAAAPVLFNTIDLTDREIYIKATRTF